METITFRCTACQAVLKVGADKAGRGAKCTKCGTALTIPTRKEPAKPPPPPPTAAKKADKGEDDGDLTFAVKELPNLEEERRQQEEAGKTKTKTKSTRKETKKLAKITNAQEWRKVGVGMKVIAGGLCVWLAAFVVFKVPLVVGLTVGPEYAKAASENRLFTRAADSDPAAQLNLCNYAVALIAGQAWADTMIWFLRLSLVLSLLQYGPLLLGYVMCLATPNRFGTRLQLRVLLALAFFNFLFLLAFKVLPIFGSYRYIILPFALPEVALGDMNAERLQTVFTFWLKWPILEAYGTILMTLMQYMEPALIGSFIFAVGKGILSEELEGKGYTVMLLAYSQLFIQLVWLMSALCGAPMVLLLALRITYAVGAGFFIYQLSCTISALFSVSGAVEEQLGDEADAPPKDEDDENEEDEDDEDE